jgi:hypothetical protein
MSCGKSEFCRENYAMIADFLENRNIPKTAIIFYDAGNAFFSDGVTVFQNMGYYNAIQLTPIIHQLVSVNDNKAHGWAKSLWKALSINWNDDIVVSLSLLKYCREYPPEYVRRDWQRNFLLEQGLSAANLEQNVPLDAENNFHEECCREYMRMYDLDALLQRPIYPGTPKKLKSNMDGDYWITP